MKWEYKITNYDVDDNPPSFSELGLQGWELVSSGKYRHIFKRPLSEPDAKPVEIVHGENCPKVEHVDEADRIGHGPDDDGPYWIDGILYCGRCHRWVESYGEVKSVPSETDRLKSELDAAKNELESACRRHAAELERAAQYKGISIQYREIVCTLCEAIKPIVAHFESGRSSATIPDARLVTMTKAYHATKAATCAEVENEK